MINISKLTIKKIIIDSYQPQFKFNWATLIIKDCYFVLVYHLHYPTNHLTYDHFALAGINIMGDSYFSHITMSSHSKILLLYNETDVDTEHHTLELNNCTVKAL